MKTFKKILLIICIIITTIGMFILGRQGLNYAEGYTQALLLDTINDYTFYVSVATIIILVYLVIRYNKQGTLRVISISILGIIGSIVFLLAIMAISRMPITRFFFPIMLVAYVSSIIVLSSYFEEKL